MVHRQVLVNIRHLVVQELVVGGFSPWQSEILKADFVKEFLGAIDISIRFPFQNMVKILKSMTSIMAPAEHSHGGCRSRQRPPSSARLCTCASTARVPLAMAGARAASRVAAASIAPERLTATGAATTPSSAARSRPGATARCGARGPKAASALPRRRRRHPRRLRHPRQSRGPPGHRAASRCGCMPAAPSRRPSTVLHGSPPGRPTPA